MTTSCTVNPTTKWDRGLRKVVELRLQPCSAGAPRTSRPLPLAHSLRTHILDGFRTGLLRRTARDFMLA